MLIDQPSNHTFQTSQTKESDFLDAESVQSSDTESEFDFDMTKITISWIDPNFGLNAITSTIFPKIYESFFSSDRYSDNQIRRDILPKA